MGVDVIEWETFNSLIFQGSTYVASNQIRMKPNESLQERGS